MTDTSPTPTSLAAGFQRLKVAAAAAIPPRQRMLETATTSLGSLRPGGVWALADGLLVLVVEATGLTASLGDVLRVAPVFSEIEFASAEDAILPARVLGWEAGVAFGCEFPVNQGSLKRCLGHLPAAWMEKLNAFRQRMEGEEAPFPSGILTGRVFTDVQDPGFLFHEALVIRMTSVMAPVLADCLVS